LGGESLPQRIDLIEELLILLGEFAVLLLEPAVLLDQLIDGPQELHATLGWHLRGARALRPERE
jgi:hypothetical protein